MNAAMGSVAGSGSSRPAGQSRYDTPHRAVSQLFRRNLPGPNKKPPEGGFFNSVLISRA